MADAYIGNLTSISNKSASTLYTVTNTQCANYSFVLISVFYLNLLLIYGTLLHYGSRKCLYTGLALCGLYIGWLYTGLALCQYTPFGYTQG